jgi:hypothetical protein
MQFDITSVGEGLGPPAETARHIVRVRGTMGLRPKPHLRTFEKVLKNPKTFKKGGRGTRFLTLGSAALRIPSVVRTWGRPVALTSSDEPRRIKPPPQARTGRWVRLNVTSVGEGLGPPAETMPHFVRCIVHICAICTNMRGELCKKENSRKFLDKRTHMCYNKIAPEGSNS